MCRVALIPARGGSKGIPRKNIKLFNFKPLIYWSIVAAQESNHIDRVIVSTEDQEIADVARKYSAEVPFLRPKKFAMDNSPGIDPVIHLLENIDNVESLLLLQPTSPLRETKHINEIFELKERFNAESVVSVSLAKKNIIFAMDENNLLSSISKEFKLLPRQEFSNLYNLNGALYLSSTESILRNRSFFSPTTLGYIMPEEYSVDIDTPLDWEIAEFLMSRKV